MAMSDALQTSEVVVIIGAGEMGAAVGRRLRGNGVRVLTPLAGRSAESVERVRQAGLEVVDDADRLAQEADFILSIVPPGVAVEVAQRLHDPLRRASKKPVFAECNAISPVTINAIEKGLADTGCRFVDAGIIGGPPPADRLKGGPPRFYVSGADAHLLGRLAHYGLDIAVIDGPVGAASGLKMSYAGLTKGLTALGAAMIAGAARDGLGEMLLGELARTQPDLLRRLERSIPQMFPKAYRWVAEMEQIAEFLGGAGAGAMVYEGAARLYESIAAEFEGGGITGERIAALEEFCKGAKQ
jgi:3-hydroxyisobutyrate dehydrogenase-like beta-hydroxyacid dehydrogenase